MRTIQDIRIYKSTVENIPGNPTPTGIMNRELNCVIFRIAMKLREQGFSLGEFHHLYINLTTCKVDGGISLSKRGKSPCAPWYRYYDVEVSQEFYDSLEGLECFDSVIAKVEEVLLRFATSDFDAAKISACVDEAVTLGEKMTMVFKEKQSSKNRAVIYLRYLDTVRFFPLIKVFDLDGNVIFEHDLPETASLDAFGEIRLSSKKITINPRKNCFAKDLEPISFEL